MSTPSLLSLWLLFLGSLLLASCGGGDESGGASSAAFTASGGFIEKSGSDIRPRLSPSEVRSFVPGGRGPFRFPAPYHTEGIKLTAPGDCAPGQDCLFYVGYSYWRNINNHLNDGRMLILLSFDKRRGGGGPTLLSVDKATDAVTNLGPLFDDSSPFSWSNGEGWYFSGSQPTTLYLNDGPRMLRYDVIAKRFDTVFDASRYGTDRYIWQMHSSDDDRFHSATLRVKSTGESLGCLFYREDQQELSFFPKIGAFDECHLDKSGRWLVSLENVDGQYDVDMRVFDTSAGVERARILDQDGAPGHLDMGYGYLVGQDNWSPLPNAAVTWRLGSTPAKGPAVFTNYDWNVSAANHLSHANAKPGVPMERQFACGSDASTVSYAADEVVCFRLDGSRDVLVVAPVMTNLAASGGGGDAYAKMPKGNLDVAGNYFIWTTNLGGNRLEALLVKVPAGLLIGG